MLINIQDSAYKDLKKIDKKEAIKILQTIKKLRLSTYYKCKKINKSLPAI